MNTTIQQQIEDIARECAERIHNAGEEAVTISGCTLSLLEEMDLVLTAASRIAALKVKESGAVEALDSCRMIDSGDSVGLHDDYDHDKVSHGLAALRTIITEGTP